MTPNFKKVIKDLNAAGWTQADIAAWVGCGQTNISAILRGREPKYGLGSRLVALHDTECKGHRRPEVTV